MNLLDGTIHGPVTKELCRKMAARARRYMVAYAELEKECSYKDVLDPNNEGFSLKEIEDKQRAVKSHRSPLDNRNDAEFLKQLDDSHSRMQPREKMKDPPKSSSDTPPSQPIHNSSSSTSSSLVSKTANKQKEPTADINQGAKRNSSTSKSHTPNKRKQIMGNTTQEALSYRSKRVKVSDEGCVRSSTSVQNKQSILRKRKPSSNNILSSSQIAKKQKCTGNTTISTRSKETIMGCDDRNHISSPLI